MIRYERQGKAGIFINRYLNVFAMVAAPLICLFFWLFYIRGSYNYTEHLIACLYMEGYMNLFHSLILTPVQMAFGVTATNPSFMWSIAYGVIQITYYSIFYYKFINRRTIGGALLALGASTFAVAFWFVFTGFLVGVYIYTGFWGIFD